MAKGYRIGESEEDIAWKVLDFEYTELGNEHTLEDLAHFLDMVKAVPFGEAPTADWQITLAEFRRRYGEVEGVWICPTLRDALTYYGAFYGEGATIYEVGYDPDNVVIDMGPDGIFVLDPEYTREVGTDLLAPLKGLMAKVYQQFRNGGDKPLLQ